MRFIEFVAMIAAIGILATPALAQPGQCPSGMQMCGTPKTGGRCYNPVRAGCSEGLICTKGMIGCAAGAWGKGGCIRPSDSRCDKGMICSKQMLTCAPGAKGNGGCYARGYSSCDDGAITSP
jgi:hypothetical protein